MSRDPSKQVAITGVGGICGLGHNIKDIWQNVLAGKSGVGAITQRDPERLPISIAGEVKNFSVSENLIPEKDLKKYDRFVHFAIHAANEAISDANLISPLTDGLVDRDRVGCILGVGMGGFHLIEDNYENFLNRGPRRVSPFFIPSVIPNMASGLISLVFNLMGKHCDSFSPQNFGDYGT